MEEIDILMAYEKQLGLTAFLKNKLVLLQMEKTKRVSYMYMVIVFYPPFCKIVRFSENRERNL